MYGDVFCEAPVFVTGHTGFKGAWLSLMLSQLGAKVIGYALSPPTTPSLFAQSGLAANVTHIEADIRDQVQLIHALRAHHPRFIFHLAAQSLVLDAYRNPLETYDINVMGSLKLLDAVRQTGISTTIIMVVTDKCYQNNEWVYGYRENDALGGYDPYSASKAAMDIASQSYQLSFFPLDAINEHGVSVATVRSGNVIGGGDWAYNRIVPDAIRAFFNGESLQLRNPSAVRPWQHVLEPLSGYLWLAAQLSRDPARFTGGWNFGPLPTEGSSVRMLADTMVSAWGDGVQWHDASTNTTLYEANLLRLNIDKAVSMLGWSPVWDFQTTVERTVRWYKASLDANAKQTIELCADDIAAYVQSASKAGLAWTS